ncbi:hypothetical protein [Belnapia rosea]|uniref:hypothetical protein n=1 Tax=Belnapia rosea TaxID=938405 RepID=UPI00115F81C1|nr:hypothetical protein [Belnapia rosea]
MGESSLLHIAGTYSQARARVAAVLARMNTLPSRISISTALTKANTNSTSPARGPATEGPVLQ